MRVRGIAYDTGFVNGDDTSVRTFDPAEVGADLTVIRDELHCDAVQLVGGDPGRLATAARIAHHLGLRVWLSPYPLNLTPDEIRALFRECVDRAGPYTNVFVTGAELTVMNKGFVDGDRLEDRLAQLLTDPSCRAEARQKLGNFLRTAVAEIRERFPGSITYAAIQFEAVDWDIFDFTTYELIRSADVAAQFRAGVRTIVEQSAKPVVITGFGCATWRGAAEVAQHSIAIVGPDGRLDGDYERDEEGQAAYLGELLDIFDEEGAHGAFVYLFALPSFPHRPGGDPRDDLDLASGGIVKVFDDGHWEPKAAFATVAGRYARSDGFVLAPQSSTTTRSPGAGE